MVKMWSDREKKVAEKIPGTKITRYYLWRHLHRVISRRRHLCPKPPETFECKLYTQISQGEAEYGLSGFTPPNKQKNKLSCCKYSSRNSLLVASIVDSSYWCFAITCLACLFFKYVTVGDYKAREPNRDALTLWCVQYSASSVGSAGECACWCDLRSQHFWRSRELFDTEWFATVGSRSFCASGGKQRSGGAN